MTIKELINIIGGPDAVANAISNGKPTKATKESIRHWGKRGIPERHWVKLAKVAGLDVRDVAGVVRD